MGEGDTSRLATLPMVQSMLSCRDTADHSSFGKHGNVENDLEDDMCGVAAAGNEAVDDATSRRT